MDLLQAIPTPSAPSAAMVLGFGRIYDGTLTVTDKIKPGGFGAVGTLVFECAPIVAGASLESEMIAGEGDLLKVEGAFDISGLSLDVPSFTEFPEYSVKVIEASERTGALMSDNFSNHTELFVVSYATDGVWIKRNNGSMVIIK